MIILFQLLGESIGQDILKEKRAEYGKEIVSTLSRQLADDYDNNFNEKNFRRMIQFAEVCPDKGIVVTVSRQLCWSHFVAIPQLKDDFQRDFCTEMCWYMTELPERKLLEQKLHKAVEMERKRLEAKPA